MALRTYPRRSDRARLDAELRALEELAQRRVRAVGRCPECGRRVERDEEWLRAGGEVWHVECAGSEWAVGSGQWAARESEPRRWQERG